MLRQSSLEIWPLWILMLANFKKGTPCSCTYSISWESTPVVQVLADREASDSAMTLTCLMHKSQANGGPLVSLADEALISSLKSFIQKHQHLPLPNFRYNSNQHGLLGVDLTGICNRPLNKIRHVSQWEQELNDRWHGLSVEQAPFKANMTEGLPRLRERLMAVAKGTLSQKARILGETVLSSLVTHAVMPVRDLTKKLRMCEISTN